MKLVKKIQDGASIVITIFVVLIFAAMMFVVIKGLNDWRDPQLWLDTAFYTFLQIIMICTWLPEGKKRGEQDETYIANRDEANDKMKTAIRPENFNSLTQFCLYATDQNMQAWVAKKVSRFGVVYSQWNSDVYRKQFSDKVARKVRKFELRAPGKVQPIKATEITSATEVYLIFDTTNYTKRAEKVKLAVRIGISIVMSTIGAFLAFDRFAFTWESVVEFLYWCLIMIVTIFYSLRIGTQLMTVESNDYFKRIIDFLNRFEVWQNENITPITTQKLIVEQEKMQQII